MTLERSTRCAVNIYDDTIGVTGQVDSRIDLDLCHLLVNLGLKTNARQTPTQKREEWCLPSSRACST